MMKKIGSDVTGTRTGSLQPYGPVTPLWRHHPAQKERVLSVLKQGEKLTISQVSRKSDTAWSTAYNILKTLLLQGIVEASRSGNSVYFQLKKQEVQTK